jgi:hypothetical protein
MVEKICISSGTIDAYGLEVLSTFQSNFRIHFGGGPVEVHLLYIPLIEKLEILIQKRYLISLKIVFPKKRLKKCSCCSVYPPIWYLWNCAPRSGRLCNFDMFLDFPK